MSMKKKIIIALILVTSLVIGSVLLIKCIERENSEGLKKNQEGTAQDIEDNDEYELPPITPDENGDNSSTSDSEDITNGILAEEEKNDEPTGTEEKEDNKIDSSKTYVELPFVPAE